MNTRILPLLSFYNPIRHVAKVTVPILFIGATQDTTCPIEFIHKAVALNPSLAKIVELNTTHFKLYAPGPLRDRASSEAVNFVKSLSME
jgi:pimeloyl-ACP methyl ester carboxylesterase